MFTGIIANLGKVAKWKPTKDGGKLFVQPKKKYTKVKIGESIAINGCCLTVVTYKNNVLEFDVSDETMRKTALHQLDKGMTVNLERAMMASDRVGGHFVLGHVDGVGKIKKITHNPGSIDIKVAYPKKFAKLLIDKGSVAVDGISLTVCDLTTTHFHLYIIPHTMNETHLGCIEEGDQVNLEFDVLGKYILGWGRAA